MKILHVVTLVSPDAAMGGAMRVALHQCRALIERGHDVTLVAAGRGFDAGFPPTVLGVPVVLFPATTVLPGLGFSGFRARGLGRWLRRAVEQADLVHLHVTRDLVTLPAVRLVRRAGVPYLLQPHGQIDPSSRVLARLYDRLLVSRELRSAPTVLCLTPAEAPLVEAVARGPVRWRELPNAVDADLVPEPVQPDREVLFLARLAERKRPLAFVRAAAEIARIAPEWTFAVVGPDEGLETAVREEIRALGAPVQVEGALDPALVPARMRRCAVYVLPALDEPFGLTVIEAMVQERPVVVLDDCGLAPVVETAGAGLVVDSSHEALVDALTALVGDDEERVRMGRRGRAAVLQDFTVEAAGARLEGCYEELVR